ncbi:hypothetical protein FJZ31_30210 [Candidatus Poribacteria bacterium]|nr:hypothetical protein [Candidatus Poribacteria bacterium]
MNIEQRAVFFNHIILDDAMDEYGIVRHQLTYPDRRSITDKMLEYVREEKERRKVSGKKWHPLAGTPGYAMYEDANYVGNRYLVSQVWRWLATKQPQVREDAEQAYQATMYPYREGAKLERGYWPKPYGALRGEYAIDKNYTETSVDQAYSPVIALWRYYQHLADESEKKEIGEALQAHGHWWINHDYKYDYLGEVWAVFGERIGSPSSALKIPIGMHLAYQITGDIKLRDECVRIIRKAVNDGALKMPRGPRGEIKELYHWAEMYDYFMRETELSNEADWPRLIKECWQAAKSTIQEDGLCIGMGHFTNDGLIEKYEPGPINDVHHGYWKTGARHPASTAQMACLAMLIHELGYDSEAGIVGKMLLENITEAHTGVISGYIFTSPEQMPPAYRDNPPPKFFSTRVVVFWLDAYWRGKLHDV